MADDGTTGAPDPNPWQQPQQQEPGWQPSSHGSPPEPSAWSPSPEQSPWSSPPEQSPWSPSPEQTAWSSPSNEYGSYQNQNPPPAGAPWMYGPPQLPPKKSRTGLIVALAAVAAILLLGGGLAVLGLVSNSSDKTAAQNDGNFTPAASAPDSTPSSSDPEPTPTPTPTPVAPSVSLKIPASVAGYKQLKGSVTKRAIQDMRKKMSGGSSLEDQIYGKAKIALYTKGSSRLVFIGLAGSDSPVIAKELSLSPSSEVDSVFAGSGIDDPKDYSAGSRGGVLRCGKMKQQGVSVSVCAWANPSALITLEANGVTPKQLASIVNTFHDASVRAGAAPPA